MEINSNNAMLDARTFIKHGEFVQKPVSHLSGRGCSKCGKQKQIESRKLPLSVFIKRAREVHGDKYEYHNVSYVNFMSPVEIVCKVHGPFEQRVSDHLKGSGCSSCTKRGFDPAKPSFIYMLAGDGLIKIGITNFVKSRIAQLKSRTPFDFELVQLIRIDGLAAHNLETLCHRALVSANLTGIDGATEWFNYDGAVVQQLLKTIRTFEVQ